MRLELLFFLSWVERYLDSRCAQKEARVPVTGGNLEGIFHNAKHPHMICCVPNLKIWAERAYYISYALAS
jgi:hypothetical protein